MTALDDRQVRRYARHILLLDIGGAGQARFLASSVVVEVGPDRAAEVAALAYLAAAGVGRLLLSGDIRGAVTDAEVRDGILYGKADMGRPRIEALAERIRDVNPDVEVAPHEAGAPAVPLAPDVAISWPRAAADAPPEPPDPGEAVAIALASGGARAVRTLTSLL